MTTVEQEIELIKSTMYKLLRNFNSTEIQFLSSDVKTQFTPTFKMVLTEEKLVLRERLMGDERIRVVDFERAEVKENTPAMGLNSFKTLTLKQFSIFMQTLTFIFSQTKQNNMILLAK